MAVEFYITRILGKRHQWRAQSLVDSEIYDEYGLIRDNPDKWDFGPKKSGDITNSDNIAYYVQKYGGADWVTGDCGHEKAKEGDTARLHGAELLAIMSILAPNGSYVSKLYFPQRNPTMIKILYHVYRQFKKVAFYKSYQNPWNTEVYFVGQGYRRDTKSIDRFAAAFRDEKLETLDEPSAEFKLQLLQFSAQLYDIFSDSLARNLYYIDHIGNLNEPMLKELITQRNADWTDRFMSSIKRC